MGKGERKPETMIRRYVDASIRALEGEDSRRFIISFSSEEPYERYCYTEILDHSEGAVDLSRLNEIGVILFNHNRDVVLGKIIRAWVDGNRGSAEIEFDKDDQSELIYSKVKSGTLKGVSVGYKVDSWEELMPNKTSADGRFTGPADIARKWTPLEISVVSVPADPTVGVGREMLKTGTQAEINADGSRFLYEFQLKINQNMLRR